MDGPSTARIIGALRLGFGAGMILAPERMSALWVGKVARTAGAQTLTRCLGARDLVLGAAAVSRPAGELVPWVTAAAVADAADGVATLAAGGSIPLSGRIMVGALAFGAAGLGVATAARLRPSAA